MKFYPINLNVENKKCVVVGGGKVALEKIIGLLEAGAKIEVIASKICAEVEELAGVGKIKIVREKYSAEKIFDGVVLIAATNDAELNQKIAEEGRAKNFLVNIVDDIASDFIVPSRIRRGEFLLAISTGGKSPAFSRFVRQMLEEEFDLKFVDALEIISKYRGEVQKVLPTHEARVNFWREVLTPEVWKFIKGGELERLEGKIKKSLSKVAEP